MDYSTPLWTRLCFCNVTCLAKTPHPPLYINFPSFDVECTLFPRIDVNGPVHRPEIIYVSLEQNIMAPQSSTAFITGNAFTAIPHPKLIIDYIPGASSGLGRALTERLLSNGYTVFVADLDLTGVKDLASTYNTPSTTRVHFSGMDVTSWASQLAAFKQALQALGGRIDFVAPVAGIGETKVLPFPEETAISSPDDFAEPDLKTLHVDLTGVVYTIALAIQQFRRQERDAQGRRGKLGLVASVCGLYQSPSLPLYTAAKHGVVGLARSYGRFLPAEGITVNAVCPGFMRTNIAPKLLWDTVESMGLLVSLSIVVDAFEDMIKGDGSAELYVCGPEGWEKRTDDNSPEWLTKTMGVLDRGVAKVHYGKE